MALHPSKKMLQTHQWKKFPKNYVSFYNVLNSPKGLFFYAKFLSLNSKGPFIGSKGAFVNWSPEISIIDFMFVVQSDVNNN